MDSPVAFWYPVRRPSLIFSVVEWLWNQWQTRSGTASGEREGCASNLLVPGLALGEIDALVEHVAAAAGLCGRLLGLLGRAVHGVVDVRRVGGDMYFPCL